MRGYKRVILKYMPYSTLCHTCILNYIPYYRIRGPYWGTIGSPWEVCRTQVWVPLFAKRVVRSSALRLNCQGHADDSTPKGRKYLSVEYLWLLY